MNKDTNRFVRIGQWIFEVKMVRAIRVEKYGDPYDAVAHMTFNGDEAFVDSQLTREEESFKREDLETFLNFARMMDSSNVRYDRFQNGQRRTRNISLADSKVVKAEPKPNIRLVK